MAENDPFAKYRKTAASSSDKTKTPPPKTADKKKDKGLRAAYNKAKKVNAKVASTIYDKTGLDSAGNKVVHALDVVGDYASRPAKALSIEAMNTGQRNAEGQAKWAADRAAKEKDPKRKQALLAQSAAMTDRAKKTETRSPKDALKTKVPFTAILDQAPTMRSQDKGGYRDPKSKKATAGYVAAALLGEVATDVTSWVTPKGAVKLGTNAKSAMKTDEVAVALARAGKKEVAEQVLRKGVSAASKEDLAQAGVGYGKVSRAINKTVGSAPRKAITAAQEGKLGSAAKTATTAYEKVGGSALVREQAGKLGKLEYEKAAQAERKAREAATVAVRKSSEKNLKEFAPYLKRHARDKNLHADIVHAIEGDANALARVEAKAPSLVDRIKKANDESYAALQKVDPGVPYTEGYIARNPTKEWSKLTKDKAADIKSPAAIAAADAQKARRFSTIGEANAWSQEHFGVDMYEANVLKSLEKTAKDVGKAHGNKVMMSNLERAGLASRVIENPTMTAAKAALPEATASLRRTEGALKVAEGNLQTERAGAEQFAARAAKGNETAARSGLAFERADMAAQQAGELAAGNLTPPLVTPGSLTPGEILSPYGKAHRDGLAAADNLAGEAFVQAESARQALPGLEAAVPQAAAKASDALSGAGVASGAADRLASHAAASEKVVGALTERAAAKRQEFEGLKNVVSRPRDYQKVTADKLKGVIDEGLTKLGDARLMGDEVYADPSIAAAIKKAKELDSKEIPLILRGFDRIHGLWKSQALLSPGFHVRNYMGGLFNNHLAGVDSSAYFSFAANYKRWEKGGLEAIPDRKIRAAFEAMIGDGTIGTSSGAYLEDAAQGLSAAKGAASKVNPFSTGFKPYEMNMKAGAKVEDNLRGTLYLDSILKGFTPEQAFDRVMVFHFDNQALSNAEKTVARRVVPFFSWTRNNMALQFEQMARQPGKYTKVVSAQRGVENLNTQPEDKFVPEYFGQNMNTRVPLTDNGAQVTMGIETPFNSVLAPFQNFFTPQNFAVQGSSPIIQQIAANFFDTNLKYGDSYSSSDGAPIIKDVYGFKGRVADMLAKLPGSPGVTFAEDGTVMMSAKTQDALDRFFPLGDRVDKLVSNDPKERNRRMESFLSQVLGVTYMRNDGLRQDTERGNRTRQLNKLSKSVPVSKKQTASTPATGTGDPFAKYRK
jgi:hypothetical protein